MKTTITAAERAELERLAVEGRRLMAELTSVQDAMCVVLGADEDEDAMDHVSDCVSLDKPAERIAYMLAVLGIEVEA